MKSEIDQLMKEHRIDVLLVTGSGRHNPMMVYFTGVAHLTHADLIKAAGKNAVLYHASMERDEAQKTGLQTCSYNRFPITQYFSQVHQNMTQATALRYKDMLADQGINGGRVAFYGNEDIGGGYALMKALSELMPDIDFVDHHDGDILSLAMMTKDEQEVNHIREMGVITTEVVSRVVSHLTSRKVKGGQLYSNGEPFTIGQMKSLINLWLAELGADNPEDTIFSQGRDAGVPHSSGNPRDVLCLGKTIVMDIFPCEAGGGYFYDFTRTWSLEYAEDEVIDAYNQVLQVHDQIIKELKVGVLFSQYQLKSCQLFEKSGHKTVLNHPGTEEGYVHGIGHGVGLNIHEHPASAAASPDVLSPGMVFTVEPGLYYPEKGYGIRIEDTVYINTQGQIEILAEYPAELILRMK